MVSAQAAAARGASSSSSTTSEDDLFAVFGSRFFGVERGGSSGGDSGDCGGAGGEGGGGGGGGRPGQSIAQRSGSAIAELSLARAAISHAPRSVLEMVCRRRSEVNASAAAAAAGDERRPADEDEENREEEQTLLSFLASLILRHCKSADVSARVYALKALELWLRAEGAGEVLIRVPKATTAAAAAAAAATATSATSTLLSRVTAMLLLNWEHPSRAVSSLVKPCFQNMVAAWRGAAKTEGMGASSSAEARLWALVDSLMEQPASRKAPYSALLALCETSRRTKMKKKEKKKKKKKKKTKKKGDERDDDEEEEESEGATLNFGARTLLSRYPDAVSRLLRGIACSPQIISAAAALFGLVVDECGQRDDDKANDDADDDDDEFGSSSSSSSDPCSGFGAWASPLASALVSWGPAPRRRLFDFAVGEALKRRGAAAAWALLRRIREGDDDGGGGGSSRSQVDIDGREEPTSLSRTVAGRRLVAQLEILREARRLALKGTCCTSLSLSLSLFVSLSLCVSLSFSASIPFVNCFSCLL